MQRLFTHTSTFLAIFLIGLFCSSEFAFAQDPSSDQGTEDLADLTGNDLVTVSLHSELDRFTPGSTFFLAVQYDIRPGWHIYWRNPGDNGMPPRLSVKASPGVIVGEPRFPRPEIFQKKQPDSIETSFGYQGKVCLLLPVRISESFEGAEVEFSIELEWLVCKDLCLIGSTRMQLSMLRALPQRPSTVDPAGSRLVNIWRMRMPVPATEARISASIIDDVLLISGSAGLSKQVLFVPDTTPGVTAAVQVPVSGTILGRRFSLKIPLEIRPEDALGQPLRVAGLVLLGTYDRPRAISVDLPVPYIPSDKTDSSGAETSSK